MASSTLQPNGKNPYEETESDQTKNKDLTEDDIAIQEIDRYNESQDWYCQYAAFNLGDGDSSTAWVEGADGDGIGEVVVARLYNIKKGVKIWIGYGKSQTLFKANNHPQRVKLYLLVSHCPQVNQFACYYSNFTVVNTSEMVLKDVNKFQTLPLPALRKSVKAVPCVSEEGLKETYFIVIEILSVYKGLKYNDICISEIRNIE